MSEVQNQVYEAPRLSRPKKEEDKWQREEKAFFFQLPELLKTRRGKWVAVHEGEIVESGEDMRSVLLQVRSRFPKTEVYIQLVDEKLPVATMLSPRKSLR